MRGADTALLEMRRLILEKHGVKVSIATQAEEARELLRHEEIDLVIFCYTLSKEECDEATEMLKALRPDAKTLSLEAGQWTCADEIADAVVSMLDGPKKLLEVVDQLTEDCAPGKGKGQSGAAM